jgi:hypothetical protein
MFLIVIICFATTVNRFKSRNVVAPLAHREKEVFESQTKVILDSASSEEYREGRFLIYRGFEKDGPVIFEKLISAFNFTYEAPSDYGILMYNESLELDVSFETGLQVWLKDKISGKMTMLHLLYKAKSEDLHNAYWTILEKQNSREGMEELSRFIFENKEVLKNGFAGFNDRDR